VLSPIATRIRLSQWRAALILRGSSLLSGIPQWGSAADVPTYSAIRLASSARMPSWRRHGESRPWDVVPALRDKHEVGLELRDLVPLQSVAVATRLLGEVSKDLVDAQGDVALACLIVHGTSLASRTDGLVTATMRALTTDAHELAPAR